MATFDLRRSVLPVVETGGRLRFELEDERREPSCCIPALIVADAASEREDECGDGAAVEGLRGSRLLLCTRVWWGVLDNDRDGGRELRSGILILLGLQFALDYRGQSQTQGLGHVR